MQHDNSNSSRREFLSKALFAVTSIGLTDISGKINLLNDRNSPGREAPKKIIFRTLGKTKLKLPVVSMGVMNAYVPELIKKSYEIGVRYFDTAANYGNGKSEESIGEAINDLKIRDKVIISTKGLYTALRRGLTPSQAKERFLNIFEGSLKRLGTKYVDILYLHDATSANDVKNSGIQEAFTLLKKEKKIRFAGLSSHRGQAEVLNEVSRTGFYDVVQVAINFTMSDDKALLEAIKNASLKGVGIVAMKTQGGGDWWREIDPDKRNVTRMNQTAALKWVLKNKYITTAIPGYTNYEQMDENFSVASNLEFSKEEKDFLSGRNLDFGMGFCRQCSNCIPTCPNGVDIPSLMRTHMYAAQYTNFYQARQTLEEIPDKMGLENCKSCSICTAKCVRSMNIPGRINELKVIYG